MRSYGRISPPNLKMISLLRDRVKDWDTFPFSISAIKNLTDVTITHRVCFFVGENGTGKSTLLEAIAEHCGYGKEGGSRNYAPITNISREKSLSDSLRLSWSKRIPTGYFLRAESFFNIASYLDQLQREDSRTLCAYGGKSLHEQSHGEAFLSLFQNRFFRKGFYLLDEPEAALSPQRQLSFLVLLHELLSGTSDVQFIIATHSPIILAYPNAQILSFDGPKIEKIAYEDSGSFRIMSSFLSNPNAYLMHLLEPQESE